MVKQSLLKKEYLFIAATMLLLLICYQLAFKKTIQAWQLNSGLKNQLIQSADVSFQPGYLQRKNNNLDKIIALYKADTVDFRGNIISAIAVIAGKENVKLTEVPLQDPLFHRDRFIIQKLNFEGAFFSLIKVLNQLQSAKGIGMPRSAAFKAVGIRSNADETKKLVMEVYLEITFDKQKGFN
jgi:hypothetical protein